MTNVLTVSAVSKRYAAYKSNLQRFASWFGANIAPVSEYWANRDISFDVKPGEALALIGQNGAGKSTLLKMITGTVRPTKGQITVAGHISAILELGLGFNPEFTGRQNIYHAGGLMGLSQEELSSLIPAIEEFAEIGEFFDQPIRVYSSGMHARLAFALATAKRPDVLIVDEVLSVGDSYFQHKSFDKIRKFKEQGTSIILVTHGMADVRALCDRVILLDKGRVLKDGLPDEVVDYYNAMIAERENTRSFIQQRRDGSGWLQTRSGTFEATITRAALLDGSGSEIDTASVGQTVQLQVDVRVNDRLRRLVIGMMLRDRTGNTVWGTNTWHTKQVLSELQEGETIRVTRTFTCTLGPGSYALTLSLSSSDTHLIDNYEWQDNSLVFEVVNFDRPVFIGSVCIGGHFKIERGLPRVPTDA